MNFLSLRSKITLLNLVMLCTTVGLAYTGQKSINQTLGLAQLDVVNKLVQKHMENDMMHDAINGDIAAAFSAAEKRDAEAIATITTDLQDHIATLDENLSDLNNIALPDNMRGIIAPLAGKLHEYGETARNIVNTATKDIAEGTHESAALEASFRTLFKEIEGTMKNASDSIDAWSGSIKTESLQNAQTGKMELEIIGAIAAFIAFFSCLYVQWALFRPQARLLHIAESLMQNDFTVDIPYARKRNEIGAFSKLLAAMKNAGIEKNEIADTFENKVKSIVDMVASAATEMGASASGVANNIQENTQKLTDLTENMQRTSNNIQAVASAVGQLSASSMEIRQQVVQSVKINASAVEQSSAVNGISQDLSSSIDTISTITKLITNITSQINLLSLNATIEAARAGDAGKGFAVVASEVKGLASQTARSTGEISAQVGVIQDNASKALSGMKNISDVIQQIDHVSTTIASAIEEQGQATESITRNIEEAASYSNNIAEHVASVSKMSERTGFEAAEMKNASSDLARQAETLRLEVDIFLASMRKKAA